MRKQYLKLILENLIKIRLIEEKIVDEYPKQEMRCPVHLSIGQEATSVGVCLNLKKKDQIVLSHRCHAPYLAKGGSPKKMVAELYGKKNGTNFGKAGSMHLFDKEKGVLASIPIVSSGIPMAVGAALKFKLKKLKNIGVAFFGDGSVEEGIFHESINFASSKKIPVLFVCENNNYSCYTNLKERQPKNLLKKIGIPFNVKTTIADGKNAIEIFYKSKKIIEEIKRTSNPQILLVNSFRKYEHCGTNIDDGLGYRTQKEILSGNKNCPVKFIKNFLIKNNIFTKKFILDFETKEKKKIDKMFLDVKRMKNHRMSPTLKKIYA